MSDDNQIARTILDQLGGNRFVAMTGASGFVGHGRVLTMRLPRNKCGANRLAIALDPDDTYRMVFSSLRSLDLKPVKEVEGLFAEDLQRIFTEVTGMDTHL